MFLPAGSHPPDLSNPANDELCFRTPEFDCSRLASGTRTQVVPVKCCVLTLTR